MTNKCNRRNGLTITSKKTSNFVDKDYFSTFSAYYPDVPMLEVPQTRPGSSMSGWIKKHSPLMPSKETEAVIQKLTNEYDMDCPDASQEVSTNSLHARLAPY